MADWVPFRAGSPPGRLTQATNLAKTRAQSLFSMELQAINSPGEINYNWIEPYDDEASQRVIADLQRSIAGLAWR